MKISLVILMVAMVIGSSRCGKTKNTEILNEVNKGLDTSKQMVDIIKSDSNIPTKVKHILTHFSSYLGTTGKIIGLIVSIFEPPKESSELKLMKEKFAVIEDILGQHSQQFDEVKKKIDWQTIQVHYSVIESNIEAMESYYQEMVRSADDTTGRELNKNRLLTSYESNKQHDPSGTLYRAITKETQLFKTNIVRASIKYTDNHRFQVNKFVSGVLKLLIRAIDVDIAYYTAKNPDDSSEADYYRGLWNKRMIEIAEMLENFDQEFENNVLPNFKADAPHVMNQFKHLSARDLATKAYEFLTDKYYYREWGVLVKPSSADGAIDANTAHCSKQESNGKIAYFCLLPLNSGFDRYKFDRALKSAENEKFTTKSGEALPYVRKHYATSYSLLAVARNDPQRLVTRCGKYRGGYFALTVKILGGYQSFWAVTFA